ncbi:hypothetical protein MHTCC0001_32780 [Flavobacteriaceae bacterium MHTCC 0001]
MNKIIAMIRNMFFALVAIGVFTTSCSNDDDNGSTTSELTLNLQGLEALGNDYVYEGWIIVNGNPVSTGTFSDVTSEQVFTVNSEMLSNATRFVLSIEPAVDPDPAPADTKVLVGDFSGQSAALNSTIVADFSSASGNYILATPTDDDMTNEFSGIWFLDNSSGSAATGLNLPVLSAGWQYEGWIVFDDGPVSTGTFIDPAMADDNAATSPYKGATGNGPGYPGEDYVMGSAGGVTFPTDLKGRTVVISVEPLPDDSPAPFALKPLAHEIPAGAQDHMAITMGVGPVVSVSGTATR